MVKNMMKYFSLLLPGYKPNQQIKVSNKNLSLLGSRSMPPDKDYRCAISPNIFLLCGHPVLEA
ncbi:MAG: hypothetical protein ACI8R9_002201 [Paraglaciecola sp.]|jgi:hypothetical protein